MTKTTVSLRNQEWLRYIKRLLKIYPQLYNSLIKLGKLYPNSTALKKDVGLLEILSLLMPAKLVKEIFSGW